MKYALRIVREPKSNEITVFPVQPCRSNQQPYKTSRHNRCVETLQVFDTKEEATEAREAELLYAEIARMDGASIYELVDADYRYLREELNLSRSVIVEKWMGSHVNTFRKCYEKKICFNPRAAARLHYAVTRVREVVSRLGALLPAHAAPGILYHSSKELDRLRKNQ
jgi:hypothetical protein